MVPERALFRCCLPSRSLPMVVTVLTSVEMWRPIFVLALTSIPDMSHWNAHISFSPRITEGKCTYIRVHLAVVFIPRCTFTPTVCYNTQIVTQCKGIIKRSVVNHASAISSKTSPVGSVSLRRLCEATQSRNVPCFTVPADTCICMYMYIYM